MASRGNRIILATWNYLDADPYADVEAATLSGPSGGWLEDGDVSLSNLQTRFLVEVARSVDVDPAKTVIHVDLGENRPIQCVGMLGVSCSSQATVRVVGYDDAGRTTVHTGADTGQQLVFPRYVASSSLPFEARNWFTGQPTAEDLARVPRTWFYLLPQERSARYWSFWIDDQNNPAGFIDIGRIFLSPVIQPKVNFLYGSSFGWGSQTTNTRSKGGVKFFDYQAPYRVASLEIQHLPKADVYRWQTMNSRMGLDRSFFVCLDPGDVQYRQTLSFQANFASLSKFNWQSFQRYSLEQINLEEAL